MSGQLIPTNNLVTLSVELFEESQHEHPDHLPAEHCPNCWTRRMAIDLMNYIWKPTSVTMRAA